MFRVLVRIDIIRRQKRALPGIALVVQPFFLPRNTFQHIKLKIRVGSGLRDLVGDLFRLPCADQFTLRDIVMPHAAFFHHITRVPDKAAVFRLGNIQLR